MLNLRRNTVLGTSVDQSDEVRFRAIRAQGYCIGCGVCAYAVPGKVRMAFDAYGMYQPVVQEPDMGVQDLADVLRICPFSDAGPNEDALSSALYPGRSMDRRFGAYLGLYAGHVLEDGFRAQGSSGGVISWILAELLRRKMVDGVIHVVSDASLPDRLFAYRISRSAEDVLRGSKSKYYPIELSEVLAEVRRVEGRYVLVGVPCFIKAVRRLALVDAIIAERICHYVGLVCGHLKSKAFADCLAWQAGIAPGRLTSIDFRVKQVGARASEYAVTVASADMQRTVPVLKLFGSNWGHGFFKYSACEYCDDVFAETADIAVGDAWLDEYTGDWQGNSVIVTRSEAMDALVREAWGEGRLQLHSFTADKMAESQTGGLRHRREGLAYRLAIRGERQEWVPRKRVLPSVEGISAKRRKIYRLREELRSRSHGAWIESVAVNSFEHFKKPMLKLVRRYGHAYTSWQRRLQRRLHRYLKRCFGKTV